MSTTTAPQSPPCATNFVYPRRFISSTQARAIRSGPQPGPVGLPEKAVVSMVGMIRDHRWSAVSAGLLLAVLTAPAVAQVPTSDSARAGSKLVVHAPFFLPCVIDCLGRVGSKRHVLGRQRATGKRLFDVQRLPTAFELIPVAVFA